MALWSSFFYIKHVFTTFGYPLRIHSDNGSNFKSELIADVIKFKTDGTLPDDERLHDKIKAQAKHSIMDDEHKCLRHTAAMSYREFGLTHGIHNKATVWRSECTEF